MRKDNTKKLLLNRIIRAVTRGIPAIYLAFTLLPSQAQQNPKAQGVIVPSYFSPGALWEEMGRATSRADVVAIMNPNSGPGTSLDPGYVAQVKAAHASGVKVLGYVSTSYGKRPYAEVLADVKRYYQWYAVSGIFFDESRNDDAGLPFYRRCQQSARAMDPKAMVIVNPGTPVTEGYMKVADVVVTFESGYDAYTKRAPDAAWVSRYPARRFWHLIYNVPDTEAMLKTVRLSKKRNAGWVYATPDNLPNPWDTLPDNSYWSAELAALSGSRKGQK